MQYTCDELKGRNISESLVHVFVYLDNMLQHLRTLFAKQNLGLCA
jgi:hypothetical protein